MKNTVNNINDNFTNQVAGAKTEVEAGKNISVTSKQGTNGQTIYSVETKEDIEVTSAKIGGITVNQGEKKGTIGGLSNKTWSSDNYTSGQAAREDQLKELDDRIGQSSNIVNEGLNFAADSGDTHNAKLGITVNIKGDRSNDNQNISTRTEGDTVYVAISDNPVFSGTVRASEFVAKDLIGIEGGPSMSKNGIDAAGQRITNVAAGREQTDAVNLGQLNAVAKSLYSTNNAINQIGERMHKMRKELRAGIAGAHATAGLPQAYMPGKSMAAAALGGYENQGALALGYSRISENGKWIMKLTSSLNTESDVGGSVGIGYQW